MAVSILPVIKSMVAPHGSMTSFQLTFSGSYVNGTGEVLTAANFGMTVFYDVSTQEGFMGYKIQPIHTGVAANGMLTGFALRIEDNAAGAGAFQELASGAYPGGITGGFCYLFAHGR